jgi:hypothetical protein
LLCLRGPGVDQRGSRIMHTQMEHTESIDFGAQQIQADSRKNTLIQSFLLQEIGANRFTKSRMHTSSSFRRLSGRRRCIEYICEKQKIQEQVASRIPHLLQERFVIPNVHTCDKVFASHWLRYVHPTSLSSRADFLVSEDRICLGTKDNQVV